MPAPATMSGVRGVEHLAQHRLDGPKEAEKLFPAAPVALGRCLPGPGRGGTGTAPRRTPAPARLGRRGVLDPHRKARNEPRNEPSFRSLEEGDVAGAEREDGVSVPVLKASQERLDVKAVGDDGSLGRSGPEPVDLEEPFGPEGREPFGPRGEDVSRFREPRERREELLHAAGLVPLAQEALGLTDQGPEPDRGLREVGTVPGKRQVEGDAGLGMRREEVLEVVGGRLLRHERVPPVSSGERCARTPDSRHSPVSRTLGRGSIAGCGGRARS